MLLYIKKVDFMDFAFIFPGQGSQSLKMMDSQLNSNIIQETFEIAKNTLECDFLSMLQEDNSDNINQTINTQPLVLTAGYAMYRKWIEKGGRLPKVMAGHSLGEWTALVASGVIDFKDALKLVRLRAESMQEAVKPGDGAMAAVIGLDDEVIVSLCKEVEEETAGVVAGVNFNSPGQVVIAGSTASVHRASEVLKEKGARKVQPLLVSVPSHCSLMLPASVKLSEALKNIKFNTPKIPVLHNFNVKEYSDTALIKEALVKQLYVPVLWTQTINKIFEYGITKVVESGPGQVLSGLNKRINPDIVSYNIISDFETVLADLN